MTPFSDFYPHVLPNAPSAPPPAVDFNLRRAAIEFCERTRCWREVQMLDLDGTDAPVLCVPSDAAIHEIENAWFGDRQLRRAPFGAVSPSMWPADAPASNEGAPNVIAQMGWDSIAVIPATAGTLRLSLFLKPSQTAIGVPDFLFERFASALSDGALARLLLVAGQPYTNPPLATALAGSFEMACKRNFDLPIRGQNRAVARSRPQYC